MSLGGVSTPPKVRILAVREGVTPSFAFWLFFFLVGLCFLLGLSTSIDREDREEEEGEEEEEEGCLVGV